MTTMDSIPPTPEEHSDREDLDSSPGSPLSNQSSLASTPRENAQPDTPHEEPHHEAHKRMPPSLRSVSDPQNMNPNSTPLGTLSSARRPPAAALMGGALTGSDAMLKARTLAAARMGKPPPSVQSPPSGASPGRSSPVGHNAFGGFPPNVRLPQGPTRPVMPGNSVSSPVINKPQGLSARRGMKLNMSPSSPSGMGAPKLDLGGAAHPHHQQQQQPNGAGAGAGGAGAPHTSKLNDFKKYIDAEKGWITFEGAATITNKGVDFSNGKSFRMSLDEVEPLGELGKGNYGTVYKVRHAKPARPRFGPGLAQYRRHPSTTSQASQASQVSQTSEVSESSDDNNGSGATTPGGGGTGVVMAMKEIRLELDEAKFTTILKELVILHECVSPYIIDFYGAFFQEGAVYMCIEYMDGGSVDKVYAGGVPEEVLRRITFSTVMGLKALKEEHNIIHRDVKPTNILVNRRGQVKICDFGVSGNLVASIAKTNIGCQSYMAPERISGGGMSSAGAGSDGTYSVQSDVWSLGLTVIECALGRYPYPPEVASTIFSQLSAIVEGDPPDLPTEGYSPVARDFVRGCLNKVAKLRPTYAMLLKHPWIKSLATENNAIQEEDEPEDGEDRETNNGEGEDGVSAVARGVEMLGVGVPSTRSSASSLSSAIVDPIVAEWVRGVLDRDGSAGAEGKGGEGVRPALHAAPLDSVSPSAAAQGGGLMRS